MTTAALVGPDTHLVLLAGEVALTESFGGQEDATLINRLVC